MHANIYIYKKKEESCNMKQNGIFPPVICSYLLQLTKTSSLSHKTQKWVRLSTSHGKAIT